MTGTDHALNFGERDARADTGAYYRPARLTTRKATLPSTIGKKATPDKKKAA